MARVVGRLTLARWLRCWRDRRAAGPDPTHLGFHPRPRARCHAGGGPGTPFGCTVSVKA